MAGERGVGGMREALDAPRPHPVGVLVTHIPIFAIWLFLAVRDARDGVIKTRWAGDVSRSTDPLIITWRQPC